MGFIVDFWLYLSTLRTLTQLNFPRQFLPEKLDENYSFSLPKTNISPLKINWEPIKEVAFQPWGSVKEVITFKKMTVIFDHTKIVEQNDDYGRPSCKKRLPGRAVIVLRF